MKIILFPLLTISIFTVTCKEQSVNPQEIVEERTKRIPEIEMMLSDHPELHQFSRSSEIWIDKELTSLEESNINSRRCSICVRLHRVGKYASMNHGLITGNGGIRVFSNPARRGNHLQKNVWRIWRVL